MQGLLGIKFLDQLGRAADIRKQDSHLLSLALASESRRKEGRERCGQGGGWYLRRRN
jgi:hypothetical protein